MDFEKTLQAIKDAIGLLVIRCFELIAFIKEKTIKVIQAIKKVFGTKKKLS